MERRLLGGVAEQDGVLGRFEEGGEGLHGPGGGALVEGRVAGFVPEPGVRATSEEEPYRVGGVLGSCGMKEAVPGGLRGFAAWRQYQYASSRGAWPARNALAGPPSAIKGLSAARTGRPPSGVKSIPAHRMQRRGTTQSACSATITQSNGQLLVGDRGCLPRKPVGLLGGPPQLFRAASRPGHAMEASVRQPTHHVQNGGSVQRHVVLQCACDAMVVIFGDGSS